MSNELPNVEPASPDAPGRAQGAELRRRWLWPLGLLALLTLAMFGDVLFAPTPVVLSHGEADLAGQFLHWRAFGFAELRHGNLALWNPHLFSGAPFFGGFQSALLYPPNALYLVLPVARAVNWSIALHVFLAGAFTYAWALRRGLLPTASFLAAAIFMFCGQHFLHIFAGHLSNLCAIVWIPLLLLAVDEMFARPALGPSLLGMFAAAMQVFAGHPQYVYFTMLVVAIYAAARLVRAPERRKIALGLGVIAVGGAALSAVQLLTGLVETRETLRGAGVTYEFAASFSLPPENVLTLVAPGIFGGSGNLGYWGRCYLWEASLFMSVTGLGLAIYGAVGKGRGTRVAVGMALVTLLLALGSHTPLFKLLYHGLPGFGSFRGSAKFAVFATLFLALLAGMGLDRMLRGERVGRRWIVGVAAVGVMVGVAALVVRQAAFSPADSWWRGVLRGLEATKESFVPANVYADAGFAAQTAAGAANSLLMAGAMMILVAGGLGVSRRWPRYAGVLVGLALVELLIFARLSLATFDPVAATPPDLKQFLAERPGDYRILNMVNPNAAMSLGAGDIWGYDPGVPRRYAEFMAFTLGRDPDSVTQYMPFDGARALHGLVRCRFAFASTPDGGVQMAEYTNALPQLLLVPQYRVFKGRDAMFTAMNDPAFDPRREVFLETAPQPAPTARASGGEVRLVDSSTDHLTIAAKVSAPTILLITDAWFPGWRVTALAGSSQSAYQLLPADYCLRAVPLAAGEHKLRLEYVPRGFQAGKYTSLVATVVFAGLVGFQIRSLRGSRKTSEPQT